MRVVIAPDSFKGSLDAQGVAAALARGLKRCEQPPWPNTEIECIPLADGGEGTATALIDATGGKKVYREVTGPLGERVKAFFGILGDGKTAIIEMAQASGLELVPPGKRNPSRTTSRGTGELMLAAIDMGCTELIVSLGGSATNDGGTGMAAALGVRFLDANHNSLSDGGGSLLDLDHIDLASIDPRVGKVRITVASDVDNPLTGPDGATRVFSPQKGAHSDMVEMLERAMVRYASVLRRELGNDVEKYPGAGAAGGTGAGLLAFCNARLRPGFDIVSDAVGLPDRIKGAQLALTGEGRIDGQTVRGKVASGVGALGRKYGVPVIAVAGSVSEDAKGLVPDVLDAIYPIVPGPCSLEDAMNRTEVYLEDAAHRLACILSVGSQFKFGGN